MNEVNLLTQWRLAFSEIHECNHDGMNLKSKGFESFSKGNKETYPKLSLVLCHQPIYKLESYSYILLCLLISGIYLFNSYSLVLLSGYPRSQTAGYTQLYTQGRIPWRPEPLLQLHYQPQHLQGSNPSRKKGLTGVVAYETTY